MWRSPLMLLLLLVGCASAKATVVLQLPPGLPPDAVVSAIPFSEEEIAAGVHTKPQNFYLFLERLELVPDEDSDVATMTFSARAPGVFHVFLDTTRDGLETLFHPGTLVHVAASSRITSSTLPGPQMNVTQDSCSGERLQSFTLDGHAHCVYLPAGYSENRRYPVVFVFPGFSGKAALNDGFKARWLFDRHPETPVIIVGVETRIPEGTGYLSGEWERYVVERVIPEVDRRYPTNGRRAAYGHSTGGWNALSLAIRHPQLINAVGSSSPDPLDLEAWLLDEHGKPNAKWFYWQRAEQRLAGRGQFTSWSLCWSDKRPLFDQRGAIDRDVLDAWKRESPLALLKDQKVPMFLTAGRKDMFDLFLPTERFVEAARAKKLDVTWLPTELDHFGETEARFGEMVKFILAKL